MDLYESGMDLEWTWIGNGSIRIEPDPSGSVMDLLRIEPDP